MRKHIPLLLLAVLVGTAQTHAQAANAQPYQTPVDREQSLLTADKASPNVPLDSWIYDALDRLAAMGYIQTGSAVDRPYTRLECARLLAEAHGNIDEYDEAPMPLLKALDAEFAYETSVIDGEPNTDLQLENLYTRFTGIKGTPLRDSFHFGQSLADDYGRPYGQGLNEVSGLAARASWRKFTVYLRGEHQYASSLPTYNAAAQAAIVAADSLYLAGTMPFGWNLREGTTDRLRFLEAYAAVNLDNWQVSFGQQALWWGPDRSTSLILSNNAEALPMLRFARVKPARMPGALAFVGPVHFDLFFAREGGIHYVALGPAFQLYGSPTAALNPPPYMWGVNFSFKPTRYFELGFGHTVIFAGYGRPLTLRTFLHTFSINGNGQAVDPGKRATEFNLNYHLPFFRRSIVAYTEGFAWDDPVQGKFVARFALSPGLYLPQLPKLNRMDLRMEGFYTDLPKLVEPAYYYYNAHYPEGYTSYGQLLGSWIGKQGRGGQATTSYWFTARDKATVSFRRMTADKAFLQGGSMTDVTGTLSWLIRPTIEFNASGQYEQWHFPLLSAGAKNDFATTFEFKFYPKLNLKHPSRP